jgi:serine/threonine protein kinase
MAAGRPPFAGNTSGVITEAILNRAPVPLTRFNPEIPPKLEEIINKAIEKDRKLRYQHASDICTDLQRLKRDTESGRGAVNADVSLAGTQHSGSKRKGFGKWLTLASGLLLALAGATYFFFHRSPNLTE